MQASLVSELGGVPFVSPNFDSRALLSTIAAFRRNFARDHGLAERDGLAAYLDPSLAQELYSHVETVSSISTLETFELDGQQLISIDNARETVLEALPEWQQYFAVPTIFQGWNASGVSVTNALIPQTVFFGARAFSVPVPLEETLIHEYAHMWIHFIAELRDLQARGAPRDLVLPSGTGEKEVRGVLLAAHFAAAALAFYERADPSEAYSARAKYLYSYLGGCLSTLREYAIYLTDVGVAVMKSIATRFPSASPPANSESA